MRNRVELQAVGDLGCVQNAHEIGHLREHE